MVLKIMYLIQWQLLVQIPQLRTSWFPPTFCASKPKYHIVEAKMISIDFPKTAINSIVTLTKSCTYV